MDSATDIAVIGMAGRFPGARTVAEFWRNLSEGVEAHTEFADDELRAAGARPATAGLVRRRPIVADPGGFDAGFFGFSPREAEVTDPQQRLFLECSWEALESAGYDPHGFAGAIGVFGGCGPNSYLHAHAYPSGVTSPGDFQAVLGNEKDYLAPRVSYKLDLRGPSVSVQTACSSSLVAVHLAVQSLLSGECEMALAGGATVHFPQRAGYVHHPGGTNSPDGRCRAFDAQANGTVPGDGVGVVVLKPLADAVEDGDVIHGVLKGTAINNDGADKVGFTAPSVRGQADVIAEALGVAEVSPESIGYVEAHGTGTALGDVIEVAGLTEAFDTERRGFCALGTVKPNIGHTDSAAGVLGLIKILLALRHSAIPPSINCAEPNPQIDFAASPFYVNTRLAGWPAGAQPRRAGLSSFAVGGTNAHAIVEEPPPQRATSGSREARLLVLSARTPTALLKQQQNLADVLESKEDADLADVAYTLQIGRRAFDHRLALVCLDRVEAVAALRDRGSEPVFEGVQRPDPSVAFLFPGQGSQRAGMGERLYAAEPVFRSVVDECSELLKPELGLDLRTVLHPPAGDRERADEMITDTRLAQPALFVTEYALAQLLRDWGVTPTAMLGHSIGEYVAACLAGVLSLPDALRVVALRGRLVQARPPGEMVAVREGADRLRDLLPDGVSIAAVNGPDQVVASGAAEAVDRLVERLAAADVQSTRLRTSHAFHSPMMEPAAAELAATMAGTELKAPEIPYLSNVTGSWITEEQATDPHYWGAQLREPVQFGAALAELREHGDGVLLEVGPGAALRGLAGGHQVITTLGRGSEHDNLLRGIGALWTRGVAVDWAAYSARETRNRVELPTYPFDRQNLLAGADVPVPPAEAEPETGARPSRHRRPELPAPYLAPRTRVEEVLAEVWQDVMGLADVGVHDNFFDLGGHSLAAAQVAARLERKLPVAVSVADLLSDAQTIAAIAALVERKLHEKLAGMTDEAAAELLSE
ncbi:type I polyketide synthase [Saccharopolyspora shandongensis]|uniref:type I polyketide synthase n=1 Tax=Saccharopolyspora shandongensis TaxID=418495 RepID=UPI0033CA6438